MKSNKYGMILATILALGGCGFQPLYGFQENPEVVRESAQIEIEPVVGEGGYQMGLILKEKLNPNTLSLPKKYRLKAVIDKPSFYDQSIQGDNFASLEKMTLRVHYTLTDIENKTVLISSSSSISGSYNIIKEPYATVTAKEKMYQNLVQSLSNDIVLHMMAYLKGQES